MFQTHRFPRVFRRYVEGFFYLYRGLRLHREKKFDAVIVYGTNRTGLAGVVIKRLTGAKLIVEIPGVPENAFRLDAPGPAPKYEIKRFFANRLLNFVGSAADCIKLLYPWQLSKYPKLTGKRVAVFHDFVPVRAIADELCDQRADNKYLLLVGFPWFTKGVDILIRAFKSVAAQFPDYRLKLMGYYPDRKCLDELAEGCPQIEFLRPRSNEEAFKVFAGCSVYVLASRTESMGRVLLEAMAVSKPIIASRVGGVSHYVENDENGILFESEQELAEKLSLLMSDAGLRDRLAQQGHARVLSEFDEHAYVRAFRSMLQGLKD
jgi:glycosyltransferase involved in cell wall biosynthesis